MERLRWQRPPVGLLVALVVCAAGPFAASASAATADWQMTPTNGGTVTKNAYGTICVADPCHVAAKISVPAGVHVDHVDWYDGHASKVFGPIRVTQGPDYAASWDYPAGAQYYPLVRIHYTDQPESSGAAYFDVRDPIDYYATVTYDGPDRLVLADNSRNTFRVDYTGRRYYAVIHPPDGGKGGYQPSEVKKWSDSSGHHVILRATRGVPGAASVDLSSGYAWTSKQVTLVGPPANVSRWRRPTASMKRSHGRCVVTVSGSGHATHGARLVTDLRFEKRLGKRYERVRVMKNTRVTAKPSDSAVSYRLARASWTPAQVARTPRVRLAAVERVFPAKAKAQRLTKHWNLDLATCRR